LTVFRPTGGCPPASRRPSASCETEAGSVPGNAQALGSMVNGLRPLVDGSKYRGDLAPSSPGQEGRYESIVQQALCQFLPTYIRETVSPVLVYHDKWREGGWPVTQVPGRTLSIPIGGDCYA
jgi:hypothetical protein